MYSSKESSNKEAKISEEFTKVKYNILYTLPNGGTYFFFKNIVLKMAV